MGRIDAEASLGADSSVPLPLPLASEPLEEQQYLCPLSVETKRIAQRNLSEEEHTRALALRQIREWLDGKANIERCRTDTNFLLRFLRMKKFRVAEAQQLLEEYLRMRIEHPNWFLRLDVLDNRMENLIDRGYFFALPDRDALGRRVFFSVAGCLDASKDTASDMMRCVMLGLESLIEDEENQVRGFSYIMDQRGVGFSVVTLWTPSQVSKAFHCSEKTIPMRHKEVHFLNLPITLYAVFEFAKTMLSEKIKKRFQVHSNMDQLWKSVPCRILPKEYGGTQPVKDIIECYKRELLEVRSKVLSLDDMKWTKPSKHKKLERSNSDVHSIQLSLSRIEFD